ncbi:phosphotransferase family protein [Iamia majanohamensis]|uniref:Phosphotransferase family protein n=1 Tax=Iamia majanohamensis TaxID=467976 RepID=A0AAE9Y5X1_9ACTN|nr:phosphotransferase family protein [Iamia majanohamensis]WCO66106.1 phosphotransferase family protein [Iamia majanohamensis]
MADERPGEAAEGRAALGIDEGEARVGDAREEAAFARWLAAARGADEVEVLEVDRPTGGFSAETLLVRVAVAKEGRRVEERVVVKREVPDPAIYPEPAPGLDVEVEIQHRCIEALAAHTDVPVAPLLGWEPTGEVLGAPFYVMGHVDGWVPGESPPYPSHGWYAEEATPAERRALVDNGLAALAAVHAVDWRAAGLDFLVGPGVTPGTAHQLALWEAYAERELDGRVHDLMDDAVAWLHAHLPDDPDVGFCWGDPRPGNIFWRGTEVACTTDFEAAAIASPLQDLGWWLMFDRSLHPDGVRAEGDPTLAEQRALYAGHAGTDVPDTTFHEVFAGYRYAAIVVRVLNRLVARGDMPADQPFWRENPASDCLEQLLEEHVR